MINKVSIGLDKLRNVDDIETVREKEFFFGFYF